MLDGELHVDMKRDAVGDFALLALGFAVRWVVNLESYVGHLESLAGEVLDRRHLFQERTNPLFDEPVERLPLDLDEVRHGERNHFSP